MKNILIIILLLVTSCKSDNINLSFFNNQQKEILKKILKENDIIFSLKNNSSISDTYFEHIKKMDNSESPNELLNNLFLKDVLFCEALHKSNIFTLNKYKASNSEKEIINYDLNMKSNYLDFLKHISKKNKTILKYYNSIISSGGISPSSTKLILHYLTKEDLKNKNIRLIIGVHFLLINNS
jgi:organic radical activating enzyme